jgi:hypothetical protein
LACGPREGSGPARKKKKRREKGRWAGGSRFGPRGEMGRAGWKEREGEREGLESFFSFFFFHSSTFQTFEI